MNVPVASPVAFCENCHKVYFQENFTLGLPRGGLRAIILCRGVGSENCFKKLDSQEVGHLLPKKFRGSRLPKWLSKTKPTREYHISFVEGMKFSLQKIEFPGKPKKKKEKETKRLYGKKRILEIQSQLERLKKGVKK